MTGRHAAGASAEPAAAEPTIRVLAGNPTPSELGAVTAVLASVAAEAAARAAKELSEPVVRSAWVQSQRPLRQPVVAGPGQWSRYPA